MRLTSKAQASAWGVRGAIVLGLILAAAGSAQAQVAPPAGQGSALTVDVLALAKAKTCLGCHLVDEKRVGPAYVQIARRYGDLEQAAQYLVNSIRLGGKGRWGVVPMPAQPQVTESEARQLAQWILSLK